MCDRNYTPHVSVSEEERAIILNDPNHRPRRWVVDAAHSWFKRFRKRLVRFEKTESGLVASLHLAAAMICWRKVGIIYG